MFRRTSKHYPSPTHNVHYIHNLWIEDWITCIHTYIINCSSHGQWFMAHGSKLNSHLGRMEYIHTYTSGGWLLNSPKHRSIWYTYIHTYIHTYIISDAGVFNLSKKSNSSMRLLAQLISAIRCTNRIPWQNGHGHVYGHGPRDNPSDHLHTYIHTYFHTCIHTYIRVVFVQKQ